MDFVCVVISSFRFDMVFLSSVSWMSLAERGMFFLPFLLSSLYHKTGKNPVRSRTSGCPQSLWLLDFKTGHEPVELLPGNGVYLGVLPRSAVFAMDDIKSFHQKDIPVRLS